MTIDQTISEIYKKLLTLKSKSGPKADISYLLAIQMSLDFLEAENPQVLLALKHLCLCPSGLSDHNLKSICEKWDDWVSLLKDRLLITEVDV